LSCSICSRCQVFIAKFRTVFTVVLNQLSHILEEKKTRNKKTRKSIYIFKKQRG
jgi:hypothetical protein